MRKKKDNLFYYEADDTDSHEKNTVQNLMKVLKDSDDEITKTLLDRFIGCETPEDCRFRYKTEVEAEKDETGGDRRYLAGLSRTGVVEPSTPSDRASQVDARIIVENQADEIEAVVYIEAKTGRDNLQQGQLERYESAFDINASGDDGSWRTMQWVDIERHLNEYQSEYDSLSQASRQDYILGEFQSWLHNRGELEHILAEDSHWNETESKRYRNQLIIGPNSGSDELALTFWSYTHKVDETDSAGSIQIPESTWRKILTPIPEEVLRETFALSPESDGDAPSKGREMDSEPLRQWGMEYGNYSQSDLEGDTGKTIREAERYDNQTIKLRFKRGNEFNLNKSGPNGGKTIRHAPNLAPSEFRQLFGQLDQEALEAAVLSGSFTKLWRRQNS